MASAPARKAFKKPPSSIIVFHQPEPSTPNPDPLWTAEQVRTRLCITLRTLYRLTKSRKLTYVKMGGILRFHPDDVERFVEKRTVRAA
jgi:excisionase family DNA binding protein